MSNEKCPMPVLTEDQREDLMYFINSELSSWDCEGKYHQALRVALATLTEGTVKLLDGWQMVPVEPTEDMVIAGFESEPDESFSTDEEWEAYEAMSGCKQSAHKAKLCYVAMVSAAPEPPC